MDRHLATKLSPVRPSCDRELREQQWRRQRFDAQRRWWRDRRHRRGRRRASVIGPRWGNERRIRKWKPGRERRCERFLVGRELRCELRRWVGSEFGIWIGSAADGGPTADNSVYQMHNHINRDGLFVDGALMKAALMGKTLKIDPTFAGTVTGKMYASPLYVEDGVNHKGTFYVVTEANNVYALDEATGKNAIPSKRRRHGRIEYRRWLWAHQPHRNHGHAGHRSDNPA